MDREYEISDMYVADLKWQEGVLTVIKESDHLLRRFGQVDIVNLAPESKLEICRDEADEIWALVSGKVLLLMEDQRKDSPSFGRLVELEISQDAPKAVLVPFGVTCKVSSTRGAILLRTGTHQDGTHPSDRSLSIETKTNS
jgi:hypothetical protein